MNQKIIIFDICGTLFQSNTTFDFLNYIYKSNKKYQVFKKIYTSFLWKCFNKISRKCFGLDFTRKIALRFLKGRRRVDLLKKVDCFYDNVLVSKQNIEVIKALTKGLDNKHRVILLSATIDVVAEIVAKKLNCHEFYSTQLEYKDGLCTGKILNDLLGKKLNVICNIRLTNQIDAFYTDDITDTPVLDITKGKNIIIYPKDKQRWNKIVEKKRWQANYIEY